MQPLDRIEDGEVLSGVHSVGPYDLILEIEKIDGAYRVKNKDLEKNRLAIFDQLCITGKAFDTVFVSKALDEFSIGDFLTKNEVEEVID